jgi:hypothetical protein
MASGGGKDGSPGKIRCDDSVSDRTASFTETVRYDRPGSDASRSADAR